MSSETFPDFPSSVFAETYTSSVPDMELGGPDVETMRDEKAWRSNPMVQMPEKSESSWF